jgi:hypothetical protein
MITLSTSLNKVNYKVCLQVLIDYSESWIRWGHINEHLLYRSQESCKEWDH